MNLSFLNILKYALFLIFLTYFHASIYDPPNRNLIHMGVIEHNGNLILQNLVSQNKLNKKSPQFYNRYENPRYGQEIDKQNLLESRRKITTIEREEISDVYKNYYIGDSFISALQNTFIYEYSLPEKNLKKNVLGVGFKAISHEVKENYQKLLFTFDLVNELIIHDINVVKQLCNMNMSPKYSYKNIEAKFSQKPILFFDKLVNVYIIGLKKEKLEVIEYFCSLIFYQIQKKLIYYELKNGKPAGKKTISYVYDLFISKLNEFLGVKISENMIFDKCADELVYENNPKIEEIQGIHVLLYAAPREGNILTYKILFNY